MADLTARRQAIVARRAEGHEEPGDREEIALLAADAEGLEQLHGRRQGAAAEAEGPVRLAADRLAGARHALARAEAQATEQALVARAQQAAEVLAETVKQMRQVRDGLGGGLLPWRPSAELMGQLAAAHHGRMW